VTIDRMCDDRLKFLKGLSTWPIYGGGWTNRVEDVRNTAHDMCLEVPEGEPLVVTLRITVPPGVIVNVEQVDG